MNLSAVDRSTLVGRMLRAPLRLLPRRLPVPVLQGPLRGSWWLAGASDHGCWLGSYEYDKQRIFARLASPGDVVFDIGANVGFYTILAARRVGPTGQVVAFEPLRANVRTLRTHLRLNMHENVIVVEAAVSDRVGTVRFAPQASSAMGRVDNHGAMTVPAVSLDAFIIDRHIRLPNLLKIDVEGAELHVLRGAEQVLSEAKPTVLLATHGAAVHRSCCDLLDRAGYKLEPLGASATSVDDTDELLATRKV